MISEKPAPIVFWGVRAAGGMGILIGGSWLVAWSLGIIPRWAAHGMTPMRVNAACSVVLAGVALLLLWSGTISRTRRVVGVAIAAVVLLIGALSLVENLFRYDLALAEEIVGPSGALNPNRMGTLASTAVTLLGIGLLALASRWRWLAPASGVAVFVISFVPAVGYIYGAVALYGKSQLTVIAWLTVVALLSLGVGLMIAHHAGGLVRLLLLDDPGGVLVRKMLPAALLIPVLLGYLETHGGRAGLYDYATGRAILVIALSMVFSALLWQSGWRLSHSAEAKNKTEQALQQSEEQFRTLANSIPQLAWIAKEDGWISWFNQRWYEYTGTSLDEMQGWGWQSVHDPEELPTVLKHWRDSIETGVPFDMVYSLRGADGLFRPFLTRVMPFRDEVGNIIHWFGTSTDISAQKQAEEEVRKSRDLLESFIANAPAGLAMFDKDMRYVRSSKKWHLDSGSMQEAVGGESDSEVFHLPKHWKEAALRGLAGETVEGEDDWEALDGNTHSFRWIIHPWGDLGTDVHGIIIFSEDITERKLADDRLRWSEDQLRALTGRLQTARERERLRIARELHDQLGPALTGMKMDLDWIVRKHGTAGEPWVAMVQDSMKLADSTIGLVRRLATELRPDMLDSLGLPAAIEWHTEEFQRRTGIECSVDVPEDPLCISGDQRIAAFRIYQEALTNVARHAQAMNVHISLKRESSCVILVINDDGIGFPVNQLEHTQSLGIVGMRERALLLGAQFQLESALGRGTTITLRIPLSSNSATEQEAYEDIDS